jgi:hypothetical protein
MDLNGGGRKRSTHDTSLDFCDASSLLRSLRGNIGRDGLKSSVLLDVSYGHKNGAHDHEPIL